MSQSLERTDLDLRYEGYRLKNRSAERTLLADIVQSGIREPLEGVPIEGVEVLLNGFKRYRIAKTLGLETVPYTRLGHEAALGILKLLQISNTKSLNLLEQASFVEELHQVYDMDSALMKRLSAGHADARLKSKPFYAAAGLLAAGILSFLPTFKQSITSFYDRSQ